MKTATILLLILLAATVHAAPFDRELDLPRDYTSHRVSQLIAVPAGETATLMDESGPGAIRHIWMTIGQNTPRDIILRIYWDGEDTPGVEAPIADFFGVGHGRSEPEEYFATPALTVAPKNGYNIYLPMPFRERARVTITNDQDHPIVDGGGLYFQADYVRYESLDEETPYLHAQWRREAPAARRGKPYTVMQATGSGFIAGLTYHVRLEDTADTWFHGGGDTILLDNETVLKGIGGEDFIGESWSSNTFVSPYAGCTSHRNGYISLYRFFLEGPPRFSESAWFTLGAMQNEMTSVAYWYQTEPHTPFTRLPASEQRNPVSTIAPGVFDREIDAEAQIPVAVVGPFAGDITTEIPLDTIARIELDRPLLTNYGLPYQNTIPDQDNRAVQWQRTKTTLGWLDLDAVFKPKMPGPRGVQALPGTIAYTLIRVTADDARTTNLRITHDDPARIYLNGTSAADLQPNNGYTARTIPLQLQRGTNDILIKLSNTWNTNWGAFLLNLNIEDKTGLTFDTFNAVNEAP